MSAVDRAVTTQALRELATEQARAYGTSDPLVRLLMTYAELGVMPDGVEILAAVRWRQRHRGRHDDHPRTGGSHHGSDAREMP